MKRILIYSQHYYPENFRINSIAEELVKRGNSVTVITGLPNYPSGIVPKEYRYFKKRKEIINGVLVKRNYVFPRGKHGYTLGINYLSFALITSLKGFFMIKKKYDIIFSYQLSPVTQVYPAIFSKGIIRKRKLITYVLDLWPGSAVDAGFVKNNGLLFKTLHKLSKFAYRRSDTLLISSPSFENYLCTEFKIDKSKVTYLPQYADDVFVDMRGIENEPIPEIDTNKINIMFAGNVGKAQGLYEFIDIYEKTENEDIVFHIVGSGSELENLQKLVASRNISNVIFHGRKPLEDMPRYFDAVDYMVVSLLPGAIVINQTIPAKFQSYIAYGKKVLSFGVKGIEDIVVNNDLGIVVNSVSDLNTLAKASDESTRISKFYDDTFSKDVIIRKLQYEIDRS